MEKKKLICFDLDGTLIHANEAHLLSYRLALKKNKMPAVSNKILLSEFGLGAHKIIKDLFPKFSDKKIKKIMRDRHKFLITKCIKYIHQIRGASKTLSILRKKYELAIVSNCSHITLLALLKKAKIKKDLFDILIGYDDVRHPKPDPDEILKTEKLLHLKADYMVGDTIYDILAAKRAGVKCIAVLTGHQTRLLLKRYKPYKIIRSVTELPRLLKAQ